MKRILITGLSGAGKSTTAKELVSRGYEAYDIESIPGMFAMYHKDSNELFTDHNNSDTEKIYDAEWRCNLDVLHNLFASQQQELAFYCAVASDMQSFMQEFDSTISLQVGTDVHRTRLLNREGTGIMGGTEESRKIVLELEYWWEEHMREKGGHMIDAEGTPAEVAESILAVIRST